MPQEAAVYWSNGVTGSNTKRGREDSSVVVEANHKVYSPIDPQRGIVTGARVHEPFILVKEIDNSSPQLYQQCCEGKELEEVVLKWYDIDPKSGQEVNYYTTTLKSVKVASVEDILPNTKESLHEKKRHLERVTLLYEGIEWMWMDGNISYQDSWKDKVFA